MSNKINVLQEKIKYYERKAHSAIDRESVCLSTVENLCQLLKTCVEMSQMVNACKQSVLEEFKDGSFQRFFEQQVKYNKLKR